MQFGNPIVGGTTLIRPAIQSPNFAAGTSGWIIRKDGTAEFADLVIRSSDGSNTTVLIANGVITIKNGAGITLTEISAAGYRIYDAAGDLVAKLTPDDGTGTAGLITYDTRLGIEYFSAVEAGNVILGTTTVARPGFIGYNDLGGGSYSLEIESGGDAGTASAQLNLYSETSPTASDSLMTLVADQIDLDANVDVSGRITSANLQSGIVSITTVAAQWVEKAVTFPIPYTSTPVVVLTGNNNAPATGGTTRLDEAATSITTTGFTARVYRDTAITMNFGWIAHK